MDLKNPRRFIAIIPARGGSKGIPKKNIRPLSGSPLIEYTINQAKNSKLIGRVIVSTDDPEIGGIAQECGAEVVWRPKEISDDLASSESALLHTLDFLKDSEGYEPEYIVFLQATSPIREPDDIDNAINTLIKSNSDSLLSVSGFHHFIWKRSRKRIVSLNYDHARRPRRQDREPEYMENGSIYVTKLEILRQFSNRLGGKIAIYEMDYWSSFEIDNVEDCELCEWIVERRKSRNTGSQLPGDIRLIVMDFDGVFTDNKVIVFQDGSEAVICDRGDGYGLERLKQLKIPILVLSREKNAVVGSRCNKLGIEYRSDITDKSDYLIDYAKEHHISLVNAIYIGNDSPDLGCMRLAGCSVVPSDAHQSVRGEADIILKKPGGQGAIRELCDLIEQKIKKVE